MTFPSPEFDASISALCHGTATDDEVAAVHALLRSDDAARDGYLWEVELHARLASLAALPTTSGVVVAREPPRPASRRSLLARPGSRVRWAAAVVFLIAISGGGFWAARNMRVREKDALEVPPDPPAVTKTGEPVMREAPARAGAPGGPAGVYRRTVRFAFAADAPIIVGTGRAEPIELGAEVPYEESGHTLHVWDWSKSGSSRILKDTRLWPDDQFVLSPDGKLLVWARGDILDLTNGARSTLDLGGEFHLDKLPRIERLQFAPDGKRLAVFVSSLVLTKSAHPLRHEDVSSTQTVQIVEFPAGRLVCEFPAGATPALPAAFSADGRRLVSQYAVGKSGQKVVERSAQTGQVVREYEPHLREFASAMDWSPDGTRLAVFDAAGEILLWDTATGELKHKVSKVYHAMEYLRFSPDGKLLAYSSLHLGFPKLFLIDVASGTVVGSLPQKNPGIIHWSRDGKSVEVIATGNSIAERPGVAGGLAVYNVFPSVETFRVVDFRKK
jgi:hypothetical protein